MKQTLLENNIKDMSNYDKNIEYLKTEFPHYPINGLCREFKYRPHVTAIICGMGEEEFKVKFPEKYVQIIKQYSNNNASDEDKEKMSNWRGGERTPYDAVKDIFSNFLMEDLLLYIIKKHYPYLKDSISINDEEDRDIVDGKPSNKPDFVFTSKDNVTIAVELKRAMSRKLYDRELVLKFHEFEDYTKFNAVVFYWMPNQKKGVFIDFRKQGELNDRVSDGTTSWGVPAKSISFDEEDMFDFDLKNKVDVKHMLEKLYKLTQD